MTTNENIIAAEVLRLVELGKIGKDEELRQYDEWIALGFSPNGKPPITRIHIITSKGKRYFKVWRAFWTSSQVEKIERKVS